jgi:hypothetical protein
MSVLGDLFESEVTRSWQKDLIEKEARTLAAETGVAAGAAASAAVSATEDRARNIESVAITPEDTSIYAWIMNNSRLLASAATALATWILLYVWKPQFVEAHESRKPFETARYNHGIILLLGLFAAGAAYIFSDFHSLQQ